MTPKMKRRLASIAAFGLPLGVVWVLGNMLGSVSDAAAVVPAGGVADPSPTPTPVLAPAMRTPANTEPQIGDVERRVAELRAMDAPASPFYYPEPTPEDAVEMADVLPPEFRVQGVMKLRSGELIAFVDGARVGIGDLIDEDWEITDIDQQTRTVEITHVVSGAAHRR